MPADRREPAGQHTVRRHNLGLVTTALATHGEMSRAGLAGCTGLTKATASALVADLLAMGLVDEAPEPTSGTRGRPAVPVRLAGDGAVAIGTDIGVDELVAVAVDLRGEVRSSRTVAWPTSERTPAQTVRRVAALVERTATAHASHRIIGCAVGVPGLVDRDAEVVRVAPNLGWSDVALGTLLRRRLTAGSSPGAGRSRWVVTIDNEAHLGALGERDLRRPGTFLFVSTGVGIGAGMVVDGHLHRGAHGFGGELGHFPVVPDGQRCACGNRGCLETVAGRDAPLARGALGGDPAALAGLAEVLGTGIGAAVNFFDPETVVIGGVLAPLVEDLAPLLADRWRSTVLGSRWADVDVVASRLGNPTGAHGGALAAIAAVVADPLLLDPGGTLSARGRGAAANRAGRR